MSKRWGGFLFSLSVVAMANIGAFWFGKSFKVGIAVLIASAFVVIWLWTRRCKAQLVRDLADADNLTQDAALAELDADDRQEILRKLGHDA